MVLIEKMIFAFVKYQSIGIVHPVSRRREMVWGAI
jgi:hypothetical protein